MMKKSRAIISLQMIAFLLIVSLPFSAQNKKPVAPAQPTPVFRSRSHLVLVPVVVKGSHGSHVSGLTKNDFIIKEDGAVQRINSCEEIKTSSEPLPQPKSPQQAIPAVAKTTFSNVQAAQTPRRITILALDAINTPFAAQPNARKQLVKYLSQSVEPDSLVSLIVVRRGGLKVVHDFTTDPAVLIGALKKVRGVTADTETIGAASASQLDTEIDSEASALTDFASGEVDNLANEKRMTILATIDSMEQIAQSFAGIPGRKALIWVTAGFPFAINDNDSSPSITRTNSAGLDDLLPRYEHMWELFNEANIAIYPVDVRGLSNPSMMDASIGASKGRPSPDVNRQSAQHQDSLDTFRNFADMTGGKAFYNTNDLAKSFKEAEQDSASYYMLTYYLDHNAKPGWHKLKVDVHHSGAVARARNGFFVQDPSAPVAPKEELRDALASPLDFTAVPLTLEWNARTQISNSANTRLDFAVVLPASALDVDDIENNHVNFDVIAVAKRPDGTVSADVTRKIDAHLKADNLQKFREKGMDFNAAMDLPKGSYTIKVVVRDNLSGRIGSVDAPLEVQ